MPRHLHSTIQFQNDPSFGLIFYYDILIKNIIQFYMSNQNFIEFSILCMFMQDTYRYTCSNHN